MLAPGPIAPKIGQTWEPAIATPAVATPALDFLALASVALPPLFVGGVGELLIGISAPNPLAVLTGPAGFGSPFQVPVPLNCNFIGVALTSQAGQVDATGAIGLTDALDLTFGI